MRLNEALAFLVQVPERINGIEVFALIHQSLSHFFYMQFQVCPYSYKSDDVDVISSNWSYALSMV